MDEGRESERGPELSVEPTGQISDRKFSRVRVCSVPGLSHPQPVVRSPPCLVRLWRGGMTTPAPSLVGYEERSVLNGRDVSGHGAIALWGFKVTGPNKRYNVRIRGHWDRLPRFR